MALQLTENCYSCLQNVLTKQKLQNIGIDKEDIFFAWFGEHDEPNWRMTVCSLSFPSYRYLSNKMKAQKDFNAQFFNDQLNERHVEDRGLRGVPSYKIEALKHLKRQSDSEKSQFKQHMDTNDIIFCNLDFVQENGEWKIDEVEMRKLKECIWTPFYTRLKLELGFSIATGIDFEKVLIKDLNLAAVRLLAFCFNLIFILAYLKI